MTDTPTAPDRTMDAISKAVTLGRSGDTAAARRELLALWQQIGAAGDPFHRCTLAHYLADLCETPAEALIWDTRALDAADTLSDERARRHHSSLSVAGLYPSLHLNIADNLRRSGAFDIAAEHLHLAEQHAAALTDDAYGVMIRTAITEVHEAARRHDTTRRPSAQGTVAAEIRRAMPVIVTDDPAAAREFYETFLGFRVAMDQDGMLMFASMSTPTTQLIVAWHSQTAVDPEVTSVDISMEVGDADAAYARAKTEGLEIVREIRDEVWGIRRFFVRDPAGLVINVASHIS
ncbi:hypothetical protein CH275_21030 [Rhodococcus sp. 06-235-1A]|uniref:VOC family protein n=1 Tax=Rhodococcus sp. 06-235-1A TaxID=2022508 RepID=UPI000B9BC184|nr:hypothetical protein CH275_21030 [Rhodococcus sp. 06-235-1A]